MPHERFRFRSLDDLLAKAQELGVRLPAQEDLSPLARQVRIGDKTTPNALAIHPMEGCDGDADGKPDELTIRRYVRFARGGAGLLWFEATAIVPEARANPRQLLINEDNAQAMSDMRAMSLAEGQDVNGSEYHPFTNLQLTHSGRYSRPVDKPAPMIAHHDGLLDKAVGLADNHALVTDAYLDDLVEAYVQAARLARDCGFDGVDIKSCHRYLISELLAAYTREGRYGGSFENRTRLLMNVVRAVRQTVPDIVVTVRLNVYDGHPYPWGWGVNQDDPTVPDLTEPLRLIAMLRQEGVALVNVTAGNPYYTPHINRPFDQNVPGGYMPDEHPLEGVARLFDLARQIKQANREMVILGTGYSWLRQYLGPVAAGILANGWADIVGVGREAFAYPDFARDLLTQGEMNRRNVCLACSRCTQIMRDHGRAGCVPFDRDVYGPIYNAGRAAHS